MNIPVVGIRPIDGPRDVSVVAERDHIGRYGFVRKGSSILVTMAEATDLVKRGVVSLPQNDPGDEQLPPPVAVFAPVVKIDKRTKAFRDRSR